MYFAIVTFFSYSVGSIFYQFIYGFTPVLLYVYVWLP